MLGGLTGFTNNTGTDWGERLLNTVASKTIRHMFTQSESVEVAVRCYPSSKLLQGSIDSFKMSGSGLVIRREFRTEEMSFETDAVSIDFSCVMQGQIRLKQPTQAVVQVTLTQADINQSFQAELVQKRLQDISTPALTDLSGGQPVSFTEVQVQLLPENQVQIFAKADLGEKGLVPLSMKSTLSVERRRRIRFKDPQFQPEAVPEESREISQTLTSAFAEILDNMVDLDRFNLDGVTMRINRLETQGDKLIFSGYAQIERVPNNP
ncbi:DUF2993 domain-containing protein [Trichocoleus sp. DQ-U1]|uniref:LmeA family phospholipid-binding protein n=1 Tax=Trichocoleus sp. DQ-U1 TaxID=2933926 RepID=UPI00329A6B48